MRTRELEFMRRRRSGGIISNARDLDLDISDYCIQIKMIGIGDFGAKMVNYSIGKILFDVTFAVVATKNETLLKSAAPQRIKVDDTLSEKSREIFSKLVAKLDLLFIFTDLEDENISMQIAELSKDVLTVAIIPESAPNKEKFQNSVDTFIYVEDKDIDLMFEVVHCITGLLSVDAIVGDYADLRSVLGNGGRGYIACYKATGETPVIDSVKSAINSMKDVLCSSKGILVCVFGYPERIRELNGAVMMLQEVAHPTAEIDWSVVVDISSDFVETIIIATNIELKGKQHNGKL